MANVNDALMRRGKLDGGGSAIKRKRRNATSSEDEVVKKPRSAAMSSWLSPVQRNPQTKPTKVVDKMTITPEPKTAAVSRSSGLLSLMGTTTPPSKPLPATQAYIDVGQRSFGKHVTCATCGLLYTVGEEEDEREHQKFCRRVRRGIVFSKWKKERILKSFSQTRARILEIRGDDPSAHVKKLLEIKAVLDDALGFVEPHVFLQRSHFVYIQDRQVVGCVTTERIDEAFLLDSGASNLVTKLKAGDEAVDGAVTASPASQPAVVGICQLWAHPDFRRKQIATRLVDVVREKSVYGMHVAKKLVAFSQPTRNGLQFAQKYLAPLEVLTY
ncbi:hypothetical protein BBJ28_00015025 [Nothophytophthora sp. Chile5]|nr:hypothetical protein BBJ28_00015025 [Nothophytophthora sp. Chile5]